MFFMAKHVPSDSDLRSANGGLRIPKGKPKTPKGGSKGGSKGGNTYSVPLTIDKSDSHDTHNDNYHYYGDSGSD